MTTLTFYGYPKCSTCNNAKKELMQANFTLHTIDITLSPPSKQEFKSWLKGNQITLKELFNTNGQEYRRLELKDKINSLQENEIPDELISMLSKNGKLCKRPLITMDNIVTVGFRNPSEIINFWHEKIKDTT